jgi:RNA polymerase-binding protein DksA
MKQTLLSRTHSYKFLADQRRALLVLRQQVSEQLRIITPFDKTAGRDFGDLALADEQSNLDMNVNEMTYETLRDIDEAISRIKSETYGICEVTGKLIPVARLRALPFARCSIEAQRDMERHRAGKQRQFGLRFDEPVEETGSD